MKKKKIKELKMRNLTKLNQSADDISSEEYKEFYNY